MSTETTQSLKQLTNDEMIDKIADLIEIKNTVKLDDELLRQTQIFKMTQKILSEQSSLHENFIFKLDELKIWLTRYYDGRLAQSVYEKMPLKYTATTKSELEKLISVDQRYIQLKDIVRVSERNLSIIEDGMWQMRQRPKNIASIIEWRKYVECGL